MLITPEKIQKSHEKKFVFFLTATIETIVSQCHAGVKYVLEWASNRRSRYVRRAAYYIIMHLAVLYER